MSDSEEQVETAAPSAASAGQLGQRVLWTAVLGFLAIAGLKAGRELLVPVCVSVFLAVVSLPAVVFLERLEFTDAAEEFLRRSRVPSRWISFVRRLRIPPALAVVLVVAGLLALFLAAGVAVGGSVGQFQGRVQGYLQNPETVSDFGRGLFRKLGEWGAFFGAGSVEESAEPGSMSWLSRNWLLDVGLSVVQGVGTLISTSFLILMTTTFLLIEAAGFREKLAVAFGQRGRDFERSTGIITQVQRYLGIKTLISAATGIVLGVWCKILGVPFAALWGLLAFALNYVPSIGSILAAIPPVALALIEAGPWTALFVLLGYGVVNQLLGNMLEPMWLGRRLGLSALVVFLSMLFWGWTWGPVGMFLSVPLTMSAKIFFENTPDLRWIAVMMGGDPTPIDEVATQTEAGEDTEPEPSSSPSSNPTG